MYSSEDEADVDEKHDNDDENQEDKNVKEKKIKIKKNPANPQPKLDAQRFGSLSKVKNLIADTSCRSGYRALSV
jgi:hypothetical protein